MYKLEVEYVKFDDGIAAMVFCTECDLGGTIDIFRHMIPGNTGIVGQGEYMNISQCMTEKRKTIEEVGNDVKILVENLRKDVEERRKDVLKKETYEI